jgi:DNA-binding MarR family transcriptional regulator
MADEFALLIADVYELAGALRRTGEALAATEGQTQARWQLMSAVSERGLTVPQAGRRLGITRQAVQRVANELVADEFAQFSDNPDHQTSPLLALTEPGREVLAALNRRARKANTRLAERAGAEVVAAAREDVRRLLAALADQ